MKMDEKEVEKYVDEIFKTLNGKIGKDEIKKLFNLWLSFHYPPDLIKQKIIQKYAPEKLLKISDIKGEIKNINMVAKVVSVKTNEKDGRIITSGFLGDETGTIPFTTSINVQLKKGDVIRITNAYSSPFNNVLRVYIPGNGKIESLDNYPMERVQFSLNSYTIDKLQKNYRNLDIKGKVIFVEEREGQAKKRYTGILSDKTGSVPFTSWGKKLEQGKSYRFKGAYIREFKNKIYLNIDENVEIIPLDEDINISETVENLIDALNQNLQYGFFEGIILEVKDDTGIIARCPVCGRTLKGRECPEHGSVSPVNDLIGKVTFDDGTLASTMILNRMQMEKLTGKTFEELMKMVVSNPGISVIKEEIEKKILMIPYRIFARISIKDVNRITLYPFDLRQLDEAHLKLMRENIMGMIQ